ncbi:MAG: hypothetical protein ACJ8BW_12800 [Ktedonobacteraceae bacterium]
MRESLKDLLDRKRSYLPLREEEEAACVALLSTVSSRRFCDTALGRAAPHADFVWIQCPRAWRFIHWQERGTLTG